MSDLSKHDLSTLDLSIAETKIADQIKSGEGTENILAHLGPVWRGDLEPIKQINSATLLIRSKIIEARVAIFEARDQLLATAAEDGTTQGEVDALMRGLLDGMKGAINQELERAVAHIYSIKPPAPSPAAKEVEMTCGGCPSSWRGELEDGRQFYVNYRHGSLTLGIKKTPDHATAWGQCWEGDWNGGDGVMNTEDMMTKVTFIDWSRVTIKH